MKELLLALIVFMPISAAAQTGLQLDKISPEITSIEAGVICARDDMPTSPAPNTISGEMHLIDDEPPFVAMTRRVPAVRGIGFGVKSQSLDELGVSDVTMVISHPPMGNAKTKSQSFQTRISGTAPSLTFYQFDYDYELIPGIWQMTAMKDDRVLYRTTFEVLSPSQAPELAAVCGYGNLLS